jgi:hypothetical protein
MVIHPNRRVGLASKVKPLADGGRRLGTPSVSSRWLIFVAAYFLILSDALNAQIYRSLDFEEVSISEYLEGTPDNGYWTLTDAGTEYKVATRWSVSAGIVLPPEVSGKFSRKGKQSLKITIEPNTSGQRPGEKCLIDVCHGDEDEFANRTETRAVAFSVFIPDEYELQDQPLMLSEWWNGNPWVTLSITPGSLNLALLVKNTAESKTIALNRLERNQWYDIIMEVTPNAEANGSVRYWCDGELVQTVDDLPIGDGYPRRYFIEVGLYRPACPQRAVTYFDSIRLGRSGEELKEDQGAPDPAFSADYIAWQTNRFTTVELATPTISSATADPDADGLNNFTEFALGCEPRVADSATALTSALQNLDGMNYLTLTFRRRAPALDLAYAVQSTSELAGTPVWTSDALLLGAATPNGDGTETVTYRDVTAVNTHAPRRFLRVQVTRTP